MSAKLRRYIVFSARQDEILLYPETRDYNSEFRLDDGARLYLASDVDAWAAEIRAAVDAMHYAIEDVDWHRAHGAYCELMGIPLDA